MAAEHCLYSQRRSSSSSSSRRGRWLRSCWCVVFGDGVEVFQIPLVSYGFAQKSQISIVLGCKKVITAEHCEIQ